MVSARRLGIMGGTFDPIHNGHLVAAEEARTQFGLDQILFVPAGEPWQKSGVTAAEDRYLLTMMATATNRHFSVSRIEIDRGGPSYTVDTLRVLRGFYGPEVDLFFVTGTDAVAEILSWKSPDEALSQARFIAATRPNHRLTDEHRMLFGDRVSLMEIPELAISSSDIRRRVAAGESIRYLVPREVREAIEQRGLYRDGAGPGGTPPRN